MYPVGYDVAVSDTALQGATFLTAEWRHLAMINYAIDPAVLLPVVPRGTELDLWQGEAYVSLVGFMFQDTRLLGVPIPFHRSFEEVNLRFYVRRGDKRGVVFIKELVPKAAVAAVARWVYRENYEAVPMDHLVLEGGRVEYSWRYGGRTHHLAVHPEGPFEPLIPGTEPAFIAEHYWGYAAQRDGGTMEYQVAHPPWRAARVRTPEVDIDAAALYGAAYAPALSAAPRSAFLAEGSAIAVGRGTRLG
ncbi:MAG: hypothetical protein JWM80_6499 [Cyanobacteria bacterium RYN_339]|nr:hypothetical protein [Cyanobacteria bacterium RYN_339]